MLSDGSKGIQGSMNGNSTITSVLHKAVCVASCAHNIQDHSGTQLLVGGPLDLLTLSTGAQAM